MDGRGSDIVIELHLSHAGALDAKAIVEALGDLEAALYSSDRRDIEMVTAELELSRLVRDASLERLRRYRNQRIKIVDAHSGSLVIVGTVAGVSFWVLEKTLGEAFTEAFRESHAFSNLKEVFREHIDRKYLFLVESCRRVFGRRKRRASVVAPPTNPAEPYRIRIDIEAGPAEGKAEGVRTLGELLDMEE